MSNAIALMLPPLGYDAMADYRATGWMMQAAQALQRRLNTPARRDEVAGEQ